MKCIASLILLGTLVAVSKCALPAEMQWAVLVSSSHGFTNYRHQADICDAYHVLISRGFLADHIITFSYNDVASSKANIYKNKLFNNPALEVDVNQGCIIDYKGDEVTPENFLAVLRGEKPVPGRRTLYSGPYHNVFVNFVDHGNPGVLHFPKSDLHAADLMNAFHAMKEKEMYGKLLVFIEACYAGSMFEKILPDDMNILAITAANTHESSYPKYFCASLDTYLGDVFSVAWMEQTRLMDMKIYGLTREFRYLRGHVTTSHVSWYGNMGVFLGDTMADFIGPNEISARKSAPADRSCLESQTPGTEVETSLLARRYIKNVDNPEARDSVLVHLYELLRRRMMTKKASEMIADQLADLEFSPVDEQYVDKCYKESTSGLREHCPEMYFVPELTNNYHVLKAACQSGVATKTIIHAVELTCNQMKELYSH